MSRIAEVYSSSLLHLGLGIPLWEPEPGPEGQIECGDVGYITEGRFVRLFRATRPADDPINNHNVPDGFTVLKIPEKLILTNNNSFAPGQPICSRSVKVGALSVGPQIHGASAGYKFTCESHTGAVLIPHRVVSSTRLAPNKLFHQYTAENYKAWHAFACEQGLELDESDILLVSGFMKTTAWFLAAFMEQGVTNSVYLSAQGIDIVKAEVGLSQQTSAIQRYGPKRDGLPIPTDPEPEEESGELCDQCLFLRGYRAVSRFSWERLKFRKIVAAAEPQDSHFFDDTEGSSACRIEDSQLSQDVDNPTMTVSEVPFHSQNDQSDFPMHQLLGYILHSSEANTAVVSHDDIYEAWPDDWPSDFCASSVFSHLKVTVEDDQVGSITVREDLSNDDSPTKLLQKYPTTSVVAQKRPSIWGSRDSEPSPGHDEDTSAFASPDDDETQGEYECSGLTTGKTLAHIQNAHAAVSDSSASLNDATAGSYHTDAFEFPHLLSRQLEAFDDDSSFISEPREPHVVTPSPQSPSLLDPSQYPDPFPYRPQHWHHGMSTPTLCSADSSSASTRSSAYPHSVQSGDYGHVHVALGPDEAYTNMGNEADDIAQILTRETGSSSFLQQTRAPFPNDSRRYTPSVYSWPSSLGGDNDAVGIGSPELYAALNIDQDRASVDERYEAELTIDEMLVDEERMHEVGEATSAATIAEEGRGIIVRADDVPVLQLQVRPGTTHLLIGSSSTPTSVPSFLTNAIPPITTTLLALDISANFLVTIPTVLQACVCIEELNISSNPLRALPIFLAGLRSLRVLIADNTGLRTLPSHLDALVRLHTLSIRRNKMISLPSWLCLLPALETLLVDDNPFQGPWKALVEPLLAKGSRAPLYPPLTPPPSSFDEGRDTVTPSRALDLSASSTTSSISSIGLLQPRLPAIRGTRRRSFLPIEPLGIPVHALTELVPGATIVTSPVQTNTMERTQRREGENAREARIQALRSVMRYLKDMHDLYLTQSNNTVSSAEELQTPSVVDNGRFQNSDSSVARLTPPSSGVTTSSQLRPAESKNAVRSGTTAQASCVTTDANVTEERKYKYDKARRARITREIVETERAYVMALQELVDIYIKPTTAPLTILSGHNQTMIPSAERKIVFGGVEALLSFHKDSFLPALEKACAPSMRLPTERAEADINGAVSLDVARAVASIFVSHAAFMKMYSAYINNIDQSIQRVKMWVSDMPTALTNTLSSTARLVGLGNTMSTLSTPPSVPESSTGNVAPLPTNQRRRIKGYLKRCRMNPRHSQLNLEGYLLLPIQRIPRYQLLLGELLKCCPPVYDYGEDPLDRALAEISALATNMNEGKREAESRRKLVQWQSRIRGTFPSPIVQPHRRLIMDGRLRLTRIVRKATVSIEGIDSEGDASTVQVECLSSDLTSRSLIGVLCNDFLILCRDTSDEQDRNSQVDLWAVLRMQTLPQPASVVHGNALRLVDNRAIFYLDAPTESDALSWCRAINQHIPTCSDAPVPGLEASESRNDRSLSTSPDRRV